MNTDPVKLSRVLFEARELVEMFADVMEREQGRPDDWSRRVVRDLDEIRAREGWSPDGYGGEY